MKHKAIAVFQRKLKGYILFEEAKILLENESTIVLYSLDQFSPEGVNEMITYLRSDNRSQNCHSHSLFGLFIATGTARSCSAGA